MPIEELCHICGVSSEAWPLNNTASIMVKYKDDATFKKDFDKVRVGVAKMAPALDFGHKEIIRIKQTGIRVEVPAALVEVSVSHHKFSMQIDKVKTLI